MALKEKIKHTIEAHGYQTNKYKWVTLFKKQQETIKENGEALGLVSITKDQLLDNQILQCYGLDRPPKNLPCVKKCTSPYCLSDLSKRQVKESPVEEKREPGTFVGLQNTANTCWINSALQALYHMPKFRNTINRIANFLGDESLKSLHYLLQATFVEMDLSEYKAVSCTPGTILEQLSVFASQQIMDKDNDHEDLKCVSEFLENTIDTLLVDNQVGLYIRPLFNTTLARLARWTCPECFHEHETRLPPSTTYNIAAYISGDECPLDHCLMDLQQETQTGVTQVCGSATDSVGGCGKHVKVDRIVTPKFQEWPSILIIRNNSLVDRDQKSRLHVVYPETLDLTAHTLDGHPAVYDLAAVIFHHGSWVKHFSAHVKTAKGWYNFNDEKVSPFKEKYNTTTPPEDHRNYNTLSAIAKKYKNNKSSQRVSRGAFIWIYVLREAVTPEILIDPPDHLVEYVTERKLKKMDVDEKLLSETRERRQNLIIELMVGSIHEDYSLIPEPLLIDWLDCDRLSFTPNPALVQSFLCEHKLFSPRKAHFLKCIRTTTVPELLFSDYGMDQVGSEQQQMQQQQQQQKQPLPIVLGPRSQGCCAQCVLKHANHFIFINHIQDLHKQAKKQAKAAHEGPTRIIGSLSLENWPIVALSAYAKDNGLDIEELEAQVLSDSESTNINSDNAVSTLKNSIEKINGDADVNTELNSDKIENECVKDSLDRESNGANNETICDTKEKNGDNKETNTESKLRTTNDNPIKISNERELESFNSDIVCLHGLLSPHVATFHLPELLASQILSLCGESVHPAVCSEDFNTCPICQSELNETVKNREDVRTQTVMLSDLYNYRKRPTKKNIGEELYLISKEFYLEWKSLMRSIERNELNFCPITEIDNSALICCHGQVLFPLCGMDQQDINERCVLVWSSEFEILSNLYQYSHVIKATYKEGGGGLTTSPGVCLNGCVEQQAAAEFEEQFSYEHGLINVREVNAVRDIPTRIIKTRTISGVEDSNARKKPRLAATMGVSENSKRLRRASRTFASTDTIREVQNFIAEKTKIWPMLQTLWVCSEGICPAFLTPQELEAIEEGAPLELSDDHRNMTLSCLRIRPNDTVYFRACAEDMQKAAGDGIIEFEEMDYH